MARTTKDPAKALSVSIPESLRTNLEAVQALEAAKYGQPITTSKFLCQVLKAGLVAMGYPTAPSGVLPTEAPLLGRLKPPTPRPTAPAPVPTTPRQVFEALLRDLSRVHAQDLLDGQKIVLPAGTEIPPECVLPEGFELHPDDASKFSSREAASRMYRQIGDD